MEGAGEDTQADLAEDIPLLHRAVETLAVVTRSPRRHAETSAETSIAGTPMAAVAPIMAVAGTTAAEDITAAEDTTVPALDSVSASTRLTDMLLRSAILRDSMISTATGNTIPVAPCRMDIKLHGRAAPSKCLRPPSVFPRDNGNRTYSGARCFVILTVESAQVRQPSGGPVKIFAIAAFAASLGFAQPVTPAASQAAPQPNDYRDAKSWLCRPDSPSNVHSDACDVDLTTTVIAADGKLTRETWTADANPSVDCFYVYPTVSTDPTPNSDMIPDAAELNVIRQQFARFGSVCRRYAPMYRQITLVGLVRLLAGTGVSLDHGLQYDDVRDAWRSYLENDNHGRPFVLIGHSQGSFILAELIRQEIDGKPVQARMVSAIIPGATIAVPRGKDVGGAFQHVPICRSAIQAGCVIAYSSFRSTSPPPANTRFGKVGDASMAAACANPGALGGGSGELHAYLPKLVAAIAGRRKPWVNPEQPIDTPWVSLPGLLTAKCASNENATYLEVTVHPDPSGRRTDDIPGDLRFGGQIAPDWGLHLVDVNLAIGNLVDIVREQSKAWLAAHAKGPNSPSSNRLQ